MAQGRTTTFFPGLEALRGIAAIVIALFHISWQTHFHPGAGATLVVDFFFVLSGFVMMHTYHERLRTGASFKAFLAHRVRRLYPLHLVTLLGVLFLELAKRIAVIAGLTGFSPDTRTAGSFLGNLLLLQGLGLFGVVPWNVPSWSISTEFWTYGVFGLVCFSNSWLVEIALILAGFTVCWTTTGDLSSTSIYAFPRCLFGFFSGVVGWRLYRFLDGLKISSLWPLVIATGAALFLLLKSPGREDFLTIPLFLSLIVSVALSGAFNQPKLVALGQISYSIYLVHALVLWPFEFVLQHVLKTRRDIEYQVGFLMGDALTIVYLAAVLMASRWTYIHIENRFRKRNSSEIRESIPQSPATLTPHQ